MTGYLRREWWSSTEWWHRRAFEWPFYFASSSCARILRFHNGKFGEIIDTNLNIVVVIFHRAPAAMSSSLPSFSDFSSKFSEKSLDAKDAVKRLANLLQGKRCDASVIGKWKQVMNHPQSDSLCPLLSGLGAPTFVCGIVDKLQTTLTISCENDGKNLRVIDRTLITKENVTESSLEGSTNRADGSFTLRVEYKYT